ncbi:MAG: metallophosphoesterase family protein [Chloroflexota bacterium]
MKKYLILLLLLLVACAPTDTAAPSSSPLPPSAAAPQPEPTLRASAQAAVQPQAIPTAQVLPAATEKPKGKDRLVLPTAANPDFIAAEILGCPTDTSITVNIVPAVPMEIYYEYGTAPGVYTAQTAPQSAAAGAPLETLIAGLQPDARYYYRLRYNGAAGQEHSFVTQRAPGSTFTFAIQGDSHPERLGKQFNAGLYTRTLLSAATAQPDFYFTIGDDFSVDALKNINAGIVRSLYINQRQWLGLVGAPLFLVNGNHEQAALANLDGTPENVAVWAQTARNAYFPQPAPDAFYSGDAEPVAFIGLLRDYYAFTWGDALFVVIDPYWHSPQAVDNQFGAARGDKQKRDLWNVTLGEAQYQWFKRTLESSTARYKFVFAHHVNGTGRGGIEVAGTYEWGDAAGLAAHRSGWDKTIHQLMVDNGVTIFFQGHDHLFARQELDGVIYQTLPTPADPNYALDNAQAYQSGDKLPASGHLRVTVSPAGVTVEYIRSYLDQPDELAFTYHVP